MTSAPVQNKKLLAFDVEAAKESKNNVTHHTPYGKEADELKKTRTWLQWLWKWFDKNLQLHDATKRQPGLRESTNIGFFGTTTHILSFNPSKVRSVLSMCLSRDLTVCDHMSVFFFP